MRYHSSWSHIAQETFEKIIRSHGGWETWDSLEEVELRVKIFNGFFVLIKGLGRSFKGPTEVVIQPKNKKTVFFRETPQGEIYQDIYHNGKVTTGPHKKVIENGREIFQRRMFEQWQVPHFTYFFGYALVNYCSYPFILAESELLSYEIGQKSSCFEIKFADGYHNHCQVQKFYFNSDYLLHYHEYVPELSGVPLFAAHHTENYEDHNGFKVARLRRVCPRIGPFILSSWMGIHAEMTAPSVKFKT